MKRVAAWTALVASLTLVGCGAEPTDVEYLERAQARLDQGDPEAALIEVRNAARVNPNNTEARLFLAELSIRIGDFQTAITEYERAYQLSGAPADISVDLARAYVFGGDFEKALDFTSDALDDASDEAIRTALGLWRGAALLRTGVIDQAEPLIRQSVDLAGDADSFGELARLQLVRGDAEAALDTLAEATALHGDGVIFTILRAEAHMLAGRASDARDAFQEARDAEPRLVQAIIGVARANIRLGDLDEAERALADADRLAPSRADVAGYRSVVAFEQQNWQDAVTLAEQVLAIADSEPTSLYISGVSNYFLQNFESANRRLTSYVAAQPGNTAAVRLLAATKLQLGDEAGARALVDDQADGGGDLVLANLASTAALVGGEGGEAVYYLEQALTDNPDNVAMRARLAITRLAAGEISRGLRELEELIASDPAMSPLNFQAALGYLETQRYAEAAEAARTLKADFPDSAIGYMLEAFAVFELGQRDEALALMARAHEIAPASANVAANYANILFVTGDVATAERVLGAALAREPNNVALLMRRASIAQQQGEIDDAVAYLELARESDAGNAETHRQLAEIYAGRGRFADAIAAADQGLEASPDDIALLESKGRAHQGAGEADQAIETFERLAAAIPGSPQPHILIAQIQEARGERLRAIEVLETALRDNAGFDAARRELARILIDIDQARAAEELAVLEAGGSTAETLVLRGDLLIAQGDRPAAEAVFRQAADQFADRAEPKVALARSLLISGAPLDALEVTDGLAERFPDYRLLYETRGRAFMQLARYDGALVEFEQAVRLAPGNLASAQLLAAAHEGNGDLDRALEAIRAVADFDPDAVAPKLAEARALALSGRNAEAGALLETARGRSEDSVEFFVLSGNIALADGRTDDAVSEFEAAFDLAETNFNVMRLARAYVLNDQFERAENRIESWLAQYPEDAGTRRFLAENYRARGRLDEAADQYVAILNISPDDPGVLNDYAWTLWKSNRVDDARTQAERANQLAPDRTFIQDTLGSILLDAGETQRAVTLLRTAHNAAPDDPNVSLHLAKALAASGERDEARALVREALESEALGERDEAEQLLSELGG